MLNFFICTRCESTLPEERKTNMDLDMKTRNFDTADIPLPEEEDKPMMVRSRMKINHRGSFDSKSNHNNIVISKLHESDDQSDLIVIDYPYQKQLLSHNSGTHKQFAFTKAFAPSHIPQVNDDVICDKTDEIDYTLIDDLSDDNNNANIVTDSNEKCCIYCEEIYREAFRKGNHIQEKVCIYCNRMISVKTFNEMYNACGKQECREEAEFTKTKSASRIGVMVKAKKKDQDKIEKKDSEDCGKNRNAKLVKMKTLTYIKKTNQI